MAACCDCCAGCSPPARAASGSSAPTGCPLQAHSRAATPLVTAGLCRHHHTALTVAAQGVPTPRPTCRPCSGSSGSCTNQTKRRTDVAAGVQNVLGPCTVLQQLVANQTCSAAGQPAPPRNHNRLRRPPVTWASASSTTLVAPLPPTTRRVPWAAAVPSRQQRSHAVARRAMVPGSQDQIIGSPAISVSNTGHTGRSRALLGCPSQPREGALAICIADSLQQTELNW